MITVEGVDVTVGSRRVLNTIDLTAGNGEVTALIGPNGCGKTTLLRVLAGELGVQRGEVRMAGRPLTRWSRLERARHRAVLPQSSSLRFGLTVIEVVLLGRAPHASSPRDRDIAREALAAVACAHLETRRYPTLSGGERQRIQLARVLAQVWDPRDAAERYLLLDEPTNHLDIAQREIALRAVRDFARSGGCVVAVLHDLGLTARYADRVALLADGRLLANGEPRAVLTEDYLHHAFGLALAEADVAPWSPVPSAQACLRSDSKITR